MEIFRDVWGWAVAVIEHWHGWVSGGVLAFGLEISDRIWEWKPSKALFIVILSCGLVWSFFSAWRDEYKRANDAERKLTDNSPKLVGEIQGLGTGVSEHITGTFIVATISNLPSGAPTVVKNYTLIITLPSGKQVKGEAYDVPPTVTIHTGKVPRTFYREDALYDKTMKPIPSGGEETGLLLFQIPSMPPSSTDQAPPELMQPGARYTLGFVDVAKKPYSCTFDVTTLVPDIKYVPGMKRPY